VATELVKGTLKVGFDIYKTIDTPFHRAVLMQFLISEVHPFNDGNGRLSRIMMNAELISKEEERIIIPTIFTEIILVP
jgi:fido (protein-threonine AMPylation protein)